MYKSLAVLFVPLMLVACASVQTPSDSPSSAAVGADIKALTGTSWQGLWGGHMTTHMKLVVKEADANSLNGIVTLTGDGQGLSVSASGKVIKVTKNGTLIHVTADGGRVFDLNYSGGNTMEGQGTSAIHHGPVNLTKN